MIRLIQQLGDVLRRLRARVIGKVDVRDAAGVESEVGQAFVTLTLGLGEVEWLKPWRPTAPGREAAVLEKELAREVGPGHVLAGRRAVAVARRDDNDDVLFYLPDGPALLAVVHLTGHRERKPQWPHTVLFQSVAEFVERCMRPDHRGEEW